MSEETAQENTEAVDQSSADVLYDSDDHKKAAAEIDERENPQKPEKEVDEEEEYEDIEDAEEDDEETESDEEEQEDEDGDEEGAPEEYEFEVPEGTSDEMLEKVASLAKDLNLNNAEAQELLDNQLEAVDAYKGDMVDQHRALVKEWGEELKNDPQFGGENYEANAKLALRVIERYGDKQLQKDLDASGYGNHPGLVKMLQKIGKAMDSDTLESGKTKVKAEKAIHEYFYKD